MDYYPLNPTQGFHRDGGWRREYLRGLEQQLVTSWDRSIFILKQLGDFPGGPVVKNPPSNAGDTGSIPGRGTKIPHAMGQLSPPASTTELASLN